MFITLKTSISVTKVGMCATHITIVTRLSSL